MTIRTRLVAYMAAPAVLAGSAVLGLPGMITSASAVQNVPTVCTSAAMLDIATRTDSSGSQYTLTHGSGYCIQGTPNNGDWSVTYTGQGPVTLTCLPGVGGIVTKMDLTVSLAFHNNKTGVDTNVVEHWTEVLPASPFNLTAFAVTPGTGATNGTLETHIFNQCISTGSPSTYVQWTDVNPL
jgi:hypothetical protein